MLYMFAGVGIKLDHYSGSQYNAGRKVPSSQMRRGDMIFYGPNASQHVAMYLGDGQMLEAPVHRVGGQGLAGAHQRHDAVRDPHDRMVMRLLRRIRFALLASALRGALAVALGRQPARRRSRRRAVGSDAAQDHQLRRAG